MFASGQLMAALWARRAFPCIGRPRLRLSDYGVPAYQTLGQPLRAGPLGSQREHCQRRTDQSQREIHARECIGISMSTPSRMNPPLQHVAMLTPWTRCRESAERPNGTRNRARIGLTAHYGASAA